MGCYCKFSGSCFNEFCNFLLAISLGFLLLFQVFFDCLEKFLDVNWLEYIGVCTVVYGFDCVVQRWVACDYYLDHFWSGFFHRGQQFGSFHVWKSNVYQCKVIELSVGFFYRFLGIFRCVNSVSFFFKYRCEGFSYAFVVVNNKDSGAFTQTFSPPFNLGSAGIVTMKVAPFSNVLSTEIFPPCASMTRLHMCRPKPIPFAFVVNNGVKSFPRFSFEMPTPVSEKMKSTLPFDVWLLTVNVPPIGMASTAFLIILTKALFILSISTLIAGSFLVSSDTLM